MRVRQLLDPGAEQRRRRRHDSNPATNVWMVAKLATDLRLDCPGLGQVAIEIAYAAARMLGQGGPVLLRARAGEAVQAGRRAADGVRMLWVCSESVRDYARKKGYSGTLPPGGRRGIDRLRRVHRLWSRRLETSTDQVTVSAINRNFTGRSGPGKLYLASPLTVAASAIEGRIVAYHAGMFRETAPAR